MACPEARDYPSYDGEAIPQLLSLSRLGEKANVDAICVFCTETKEQGSTAHARDFTAPIGHYEEPASGTTMSALVTYLAKELTGVAEEKRQPHRTP